MVMKIDHARRLRDPSIEPRLDGVLVGGGHVNGLGRHKSTYMRVNKLCVIATEAVVSQLDHRQRAGQCDSD